MRTAANRSWAAKASERSKTIWIVRQGLREAGVIPSGAMAVAVVAAFGRLDRMQLPAEIARLRSLVLRKAALAQAALAGFDFTALDTAAVEFGVAAPDLGEGGSKARRARQRVMRALAVRDEADLVLTGGAALLGRPPELDDVMQLALDEFDGVVQPRLFQAIPLNPARLAMLASVAPAKRARLWWYAQGADLAPTALAALAEAAAVIHHFPEATNELEELRQAESGLANLARRAALAGSMRAAESVRRALLVQEDERTSEQELRAAARTHGTGPGRGSRR
jgi:hypothetical protein